jgi:CRISPR/Cas system-associated endonuclease Cas3-HD
MVEETEVNECLALRKFFKINCPSLEDCIKEGPPAYSYFKDKQGRGCWIAHTALTIIETLSLLDIAQGVLSRRNLDEECLIAISFLHDIGKLTVEYIKDGDPYHNIVSATISLSVLKDPPFDEDKALMMTQAILLHHEHRMWEKFYRDDAPLIRDYFNLIKKYKRPYRMKNNYSSILDKLVEVVDDFPLARGVIEELSKKLKEEERYFLDPRYELKLIRWRLAPFSLVLYYLIQLADNRAASARGGTYWKEKIKERIRNIGDASDPIALSDALAKVKDRDRRILLTLITLGREE